MISVIIPCYNAQHTIEHTLESLRKQTYQDFEVVIINDGSKDGTLEVVEKYRHCHPININIINQDNSGVSVARNSGIKEAKGEFITLLDADDYYESTFLEYLFRGLVENDVDIAFCRYVRKRQKKNKDIEKKHIEKVKLTKYEIIDLYKDNRMNCLNAWCAIYKTNILKRNDIVFPEGIKYGEDTEFFCKYLYHCDAGGIFINRCLYQYIINADSVMHKISYERTQNIEVFKRIVEYWKQDSLFDSEVGNYLVDRAIWAAAKDFANNRDYLIRLRTNYDIKKSMKNMYKNANEYSVKISAAFYLVNWRLFRIVIKVYEKMRQGI